MSATPQGTQPQGNAKPTLTGARIKQRKGVVRSQAKFEPEAFRDQLYKHIETVDAGDFDGIAAKLDTVGNTLDYRKYGEPLFEILIVGGLLAPGGTFIDDDAPPSPFSIFRAKSPVEVQDVKKYVEVLNKLIRRYKYLQKPLEDSTLKGILQYINRFTLDQSDKLAVATGLIISQGLASAGVLNTLQKDHLAKDDLALNFVALVFRTYLAEQSMEHLAGALRKGGVKDIINFFPQTKRDQPGIITTHFKSIGLPQVAEYWQKRQVKDAKDQTITHLTEMIQEEATNEEIVAYLKGQIIITGLPDADFAPLVWEGLMKGADWSTRPDQIEAYALKEVNKHAPILEPFCPNPRSEIALINAIQLYCYEDTRIIKTFPNILKVLYNRDVISDQAILYWAQKGAKPQGKQHFLKACEPLVKFLQEQDSDEEDE